MGIQALLQSIGIHLAVRMLPVQAGGDGGALHRSRLLTLGPVVARCVSAPAPGSSTGSVASSIASSFATSASGSSCGMWSPLHKDARLQPVLHESLVLGLRQCESNQEYQLSFCGRALCALPLCIVYSVQCAATGFPSPPIRGTRLGQLWSECGE